MRRGVFISFEGSEGCGKSTQIGLLEQRLKDSGREVLRTREPGGTFIGEKIRDLLQYTPEASNMTPESELLLFAASRAQLVREVVGPALEEGTWVIADRFLDSTTVYQGSGRGLDSKAVETINRFAVGPFLPELTFLLDMDAAAGHARALAAEGGTPPDRMEDQPMEFFESVRKGYLDLAAADPGRFRVVDATGSIEALEKSIWEACRERFGIE